MNLNYGSGAEYVYSVRADRFYNENCLRILQTLRKCSPVTTDIPVVGQKDQSSRSHEPTEFSNW